MNYDLYICGDFNIDYLHRNDIKTKWLIDFLRTFGLKQHITSATRVTGFSKSCIDFIISNIPDSRSTHVGVLSDVISDHHPIFLCIEKQQSKVEYSKIKGRTYKNYDKEIIQNLISNENWNDFYKIVDPTEVWVYIKNIISKHLEILCPIKYIRVRQNSPPWITHDILEAINDRNLLFKLARSDNSELNIKNARSQGNRVNNLINSSKSTYIKDTLEANRDNPKKFWRILNDTLLKGYNKPTNVTLSKGYEDYTNASDSCEYLNNYLADIGVNLGKSCYEPVHL